jgi:hypothetical protein
MPIEPSDRHEVGRSSGAPDLLIYKDLAECLTRSALKRLPEEFNNVTEFLIY